jgi:hypothetical protein
MTLTLTAPAPEAPAVAPAPAVVEAPCNGCGTTTEHRTECPDCDATYCGGSRCLGDHFEHCGAERAYAHAGGWDE